MKQQNEKNAQAVITTANERARLFDSFIQIALFSTGEMILY